MRWFDDLKKTPFAEKLKENPKIVSLYLSLSNKYHILRIRLNCSVFSSQYRIKLAIADLSTLPQVPTIIILLVLFFLCIALSFAFRNNSALSYYCSLLQNIAAGLITGLVLYYLDLVRSTHISKLNSYLALCQEIDNLLNKTLSSYQIITNLSLEDNLQLIEKQYLEIFPYFSPFVSNQDLWFKWRVDFLRRDFKKHLLKNDVVQYLITANPCQRIKKYIHGDPSISANRILGDYQDFHDKISLFHSFLLEEQETTKRLLHLENTKPI